MKKILIIDDELMLREAFRNYLEDYDYEVITAGDGEEGLKRFHTENPDAVLVDLNMPKVDGFQVLKTINEKTSEIPIAVISGVGIVSDAMRAVRLGAWDFITKPISDLEIISYTLDKMFARARLIRENREYKEDLEKKVKRRTAQLQKANDSLQKTKMQILRRLARAGEYKDNETGKHVIRVSKYTEIIAKTLKLSNEKIDLVRRTSPLHDIGKIGIPDSILLKKGPLDEDQWKIMMKHCEYGFNILSPQSLEHKDIKEKQAYALKKNREKTPEELLDTACNIALFHHEKWDGSGYPTGLKGEEIPIEARITAIADIYDAIGSPRPYKEAFSEDKCQSILKELSGSHLQPAVVSAFFKSIDVILRIKNQWKD